MLSDNQKAAMQKIAKGPGLIPVIIAQRLKEVGFVAAKARPDTVPGARGYTYAELTDAGRAALAN